MKVSVGIARAMISFVSVVAAGQAIAKPRVAIIGGGGAGLATAYLLEEDYEVSLYEKQAYLGGHAETIEVTLPADGEKPVELVGVEAGFQFFTEQTAPYFNRLLNILQLDIHKFPLSYTYAKVDPDGQADAVVLTPFHDGKINWHSFAPHNLPRLLQMQVLISAGKKYVETGNLTHRLEEVVETMVLSSSFKSDVFYPIAAAGWGVTIEEVKKFSAFDVLKTITQGMTKPFTSPVYENIAKGSSSYINAEVKELTSTDIKLSAGITKISHRDGHYLIEQESGELASFDHLIVTTNSADAVELLKDIAWSEQLRAMLAQIEFYDTTIAIHGDVRLMPKDRSQWSWANVRHDGERGSLTIYEDWRQSSTPVFKSWIFPDEEPLPEPLYAIRKYRHPYIDVRYFQVQKAIELLQGQNKLWLGGLYTYGVDSHESAIMSAIRIGQALAPEAERLKQLLDI